MKRFFTHNIRAKLLSLAAASLLWFWVAGEPELSTFVSAPVEYSNLSPDLEINSDVVETVLLEVRGPTAELRGAPGGRPRYAIVLDMKDIGPGQRTFTIDDVDLRLPRGVRMVRAIPAQIRLNFEQSATRTVTVTPRFADDLPADLTVVQAVASPASLAVAGPASLVGKVAEVETDPIHLKPEEGTSEYRMEAYVNDPHVRFKDTPRVTVKVTVGKR